MENLPKTKVYFVDSLEDVSHKESIRQKIQEIVKEENKDDCQSPSTIHLGHCGWEAVGQVFSPTYYAVSLCRRFNLLPSQRCILLPLRDQFQAIQLCLAKINKKKCDDFSAPVTDVLDVWNELYRESLAFNKAEVSLLNPKVENEEDYGLDLPSSRRLSYDPVAREMEEKINSYQEFLKSSGFVDHFSIYRALKEELRNENKDIIQYICSKVYIIEGVNNMPTMEKELLKLILADAQAMKVSMPGMLVEGKSFCEFDMSGIGEDAFNTSHTENAEGVQQKSENMKSSPSAEDTSDSSLSVITEDLDSSMYEYIDGFARNPLPTDFSESELYVEQLILAHIRLLINTRDELALASLCCMPGREITPQAFHEIKNDAEKKNMPMYQTILSFIMRLRLGGKGYQADPDCQMMSHSKPLGEFVDSIMKLQNIVEEESNPRKAAVKVLSLIKSGLLRRRGRALKGSCIEKVWDTLYSAFNRLDADLEENKNDGQGKEAPKLQQTTAVLGPCLKLLLKLCDEASSRTAEEVDALSDNILTQCNSSKKTATPIRIPTVLSLFKSPDTRNSPGLSNGDEECEGSLRMRLLRCKGLTPKNENAPRFKSGCSWAPDDLSPVGKGDSDLDKTMSPIVGPTLKAVGSKSKNSQGWKEIVDSVAREEEERRKESELSSPKQKRFGAVKEKRAVDTKKSKRSLLSDISNIAQSESSNKKAKPSDAKKKSPTKKKSKSLPILKGQKSITSFFKV